jgi:hypothetical protein
MSWLVIKTTKARWEAELMQQILAAYNTILDERMRGFWIRKPFLNLDSGNRSVASFFQIGITFQVESSISAAVFTAVKEAKLLMLVRTQDRWTSLLLLSSPEEEL